jgi:predicted peroxiredoxin
MSDENLKSVKQKIIDFCKLNSIKLFEIKNKEQDMLEEFYDIARRKLNIENAIEWDEDLAIFLEQAKEMGVKMFYLCALEVKNEDVTEPENFKSERILEQNIGEIPFLILSCPLNGVNHFFEIKTNWFEDAKDSYESGPDENEINEEEDEWEDLKDEDIENYALEVMKHLEFPKGEINSEEALKFIKENFQDICDDLDKYGLELVADKIETKTYFGKDQ